MNYILLAKDKNIGKEFRFLNPLTENEAKRAFIPENCRLVKEGDLPPETLLEIPLINDGITPIIFNTEEAFVEFIPDKRAGTMAIAVALLVTGYCQNLLAKKPKSLSTPIVFALQERLELLNAKAITHQSLLRRFLEVEKKRESPFSVSDKMLSDLENIKKSKVEILDVVSDIERLLGKKEGAIISEFKCSN